MWRFKRLFGPLTEQIRWSPSDIFFSTCRRVKSSSKAKMWFESLRIYPQNAVYPNLATTVAAC